MPDRDATTTADAVQPRDKAEAWAFGYEAGRASERQRIRDGAAAYWRTNTPGFENDVPPWLADLLDGDDNAR